MASIDGFRAHVYLTIITMTLATALPTWMDAQDAKNAQGEDTGIRKFREKVREENGIRSFTGLRRNQYFARITW